MHAVCSDNEGAFPILGARAHRDRKQGSGQLSISCVDIELDELLHSHRVAFVVPTECIEVGSVSGGARHSHIRSLIGSLTINP
jgi:hypothetical protein